jgi:hypothetical protein
MKLVVLLGISCVARRLQGGATKGTKGKRLKLNAQAFRHKAFVPFVA